MPPLKSTLQRADALMLMDGNDDDDGMHDLVKSGTSELEKLDPELLATLHFTQSTVTLNP